MTRVGVVAGGGPAKADLTLGAHPPTGARCQMSRSKLCMTVLNGLVAAMAAMTSATLLAAEIRGAGATFPAPVYVAWSNAAARAGEDTLRYDPVGSRAGIAAIIARTVDFGASDIPLSAQELQSGDLVQFPAVIGGVVPVVNMAGVRPGALRLTGEVLAKIYLGEIRKWNDRAIAELNPGLRLPAARITVVHRDDASGTSWLWTSYLSHSSGAWNEYIGTSAAPAWPVGVGGTGNEGVASYVQRTRFALGYVEYAYARRHRLSDAALRNRNGEFVTAGLTTFAAAATSVDWSTTTQFVQMPVDPPGKEAWPITGMSFVLIARHAQRPLATRAVLQFFERSLAGGQRIARELDYETLPPGAVERIHVLWREVQDPDGRPLWP